MPPYPDHLPSTSSPTPTRPPYPRIIPIRTISPARTPPTTPMPPRRRVLLNNHHLVIILHDPRRRRHHRRRTPTDPSRRLLHHDLPHATTAALPDNVRPTVRPDLDRLPRAPVSVVPPMTAAAPVTRRAAHHRRRADAHAARRVQVHRHPAQVDAPVDQPQHEHEAAHRAQRDPHNRARVESRPRPAVASGDRGWGLLRVLARLYTRRYRRDRARGVDFPSCCCCCRACWVTCFALL